jgi:asparagine synthase (glutamine-hydrolysing)
MARHAGEPIRTFAIGFPDEPSFDERRWARLVAEHIGTEHTEFAVRADAVALLDRLVWLHDGPFADSSAIPTSLVCGLAREHVTVALTGDGGDDVFGGYERFAALVLAEQLPRWSLRAARSAARLLPRRGTAYTSARRKVERFAGQAQASLLERYLGWIALFDADALDALLADGLQADPAEPFERQYSAAVGLPVLDRILYTNLRTYLPDDLAVKSDRSSMAHSLELRMPFLDTALIDRLARIRGRDKVGLRQVKPLLRGAFGALLPAEIWRRPKHGFGVPVDAWFRRELKPLVEDELLAPGARLHAFLDGPAVRRMWSEHQNGTVRHGPRLWTLLTIEHWLRDLERRVPLEEPRTSPVPVADQS